MKAFRLLFMAAVTGMVFLCVHFFPGAPTVVQPVQTTNSAPPEARSYKLIVGVNPMLNPNQTFSPPTNSVVITNRAQLLLETRKAREMFGKQ